MVILVRKPGIEGMKEQFRSLFSFLYCLIFFTTLYGISSLQRKSLKRQKNAESSLTFSWAHGPLLSVKTSTSSAYGARRVGVCVCVCVHACAHMRWQGGRWGLVLKCRLSGPITNISVDTVLTRTLGKSQDL